MAHQDIDQHLAQLAAKLGVPIPSKAAVRSSFKLHIFKVIDLLPEMGIMIRSLVTKDAFSYRRDPMTIMDAGIVISFQNIFNDGREAAAGATGKLYQEHPHVRITPSHLPSEVHFPKRAHIKQITLLIESQYLKHFLGRDHQRFDYLFDSEYKFLIEEFMSPELATLVDEVLNAMHDATLADAFYRLKALEMLYFLFKNLSERKSVTHQPMSNADLDAVYKVRDAMAASLDQPLPIETLVQISGIKELRLRKLFIQVFGKGLYAYFQHIRMLEAKRLMKEEGLNVSEVGYRLGFANISHFGRLFEKHVGTKPKKWSANS